MRTKSNINSDFKLGILGGGQLGKMLSLAAHNWDIKTYILDQSKDYPAALVCHHFTEGDFNNYDDVYRFGKEMDMITIEIEHVNTDALKRLVEEGKTVHPNPFQLEIIKDKLLQKQFFEKHHLATSHFVAFDNKAEILTALKNNSLRVPFVQKKRTAGYDGHGVAIIKTKDDFDKILDGPSIIENLVDIKKEIAVIVARNQAKEIKVFPPVEMEFHPHANLVEYVICPADLNTAIKNKAIALATQTMEAFELCGLLAVELFLTNDDKFLVNEVAPRPHNSGHHTIESMATSQFQQHLRAIMNWPLGSTKMLSPAIMINLLGEADFTGKAVYHGLGKCMAVEGAKLHLYNKTITKPFRKMGHVTILDSNMEMAKEKAIFVKGNLKITT